MAGGDAEDVEGDLEDARIRFRETTSLGGDDDLEECGQPGDGKAGALHAVDPVGDDAQPIPPSKLEQHRPAAGQAVPASGEVVEVCLAQPSGAPGVSPHLLQEPAKTLAGEGGLGDLPPAVGRPQLVVDPAIGLVDHRRVRQLQSLQGSLQCGALGPVVVEKGVIDVEEYDVKAVQGPTWRGR
jgi:hypothetical protein